MTFPGPDSLGRGVVISPGGPSLLEGTERVVIEPEALARPETLEETVDRLHRIWAERRPVTVELGVDASQLRRPVVEHRAPWMLGAGYTPLQDRLHFLVWANNWDARTGDPKWWWSRKAARLGAREGGKADIILSSGQHVWVDGGPRAPVDVPIVHSQTVDLGRLTVQPPFLPSGADLADDQKQAVEHRSGPVRVIAPAGSGKTRTLGARLLHLVDDRRDEPGIITAVAYNNRAAAEMRERLRRDDLHVRTIHSLGWAIIREVRPEARLLDERGVRSRLRHMIPKMPRPNTDIAGPYLEALSEIRIALRDPVEVEEIRNDVEGLAGIFPRYRSVLRAGGEVDYDEQIYGAIELLLGDPDLRKRWQRRCRHLLVDEFQDLTPAYLLLLRLLASPELSVFGVGDDDQTIYGYAGADPRFLIEFDHYFPGAGASALKVNYRCPSEVVEAASRLLSCNRVRVPKTIEAFSPPTEEGLRIITPGLAEMAAETGKIIAGWLAEGVPADGVAVLSRVNSALLPVLAALDKAGIPFRSELGTGLLNRTTMRATLAWIRLALNTGSMRRRDLLEAVRRPARRINQLAADLIPPGDTSIGELAALAGRLDERKAITWQRFVGAIEEAAEVAERGDSGVLLDYLSGELGLGRVAQKLDSGRTRVDRSTHSDDLVAMRRTAALYNDLSTFEVRLREVLGRRTSTEPGVTATTVHRVKGLEWDRVVVFGVDSGLVPHVLSDDIEEERRVLHVAITRGRQESVVVAEKGRESPFIAELTGNRRAEGIPTHRLAPHPGPIGSRAPARERGARPANVSSESEPGGSHDPVLFEALREWRLGIARENQVAAFIVLYNRTLEEIARTRPGTEAELARIHGIGDHKLAAYGQDILDLVASHSPLASDEPPSPDATAQESAQPATNTAPPLTSEESALFDALKDWRLSLARELQVPPYVIFSNRTLEEIARVRPSSEAELSEIHGVGPKRLEQYGRHVLEVVNSHEA